jgi:hypothetical protein
MSVFDWDRFTQAIQGDSQLSTVLKEAILRAVCVARGLAVPEPREFDTDQLGMIFRRGDTECFMAQSGFGLFTLINTTSFNRHFEHLDSESFTKKVSTDGWAFTGKKFTGRQ